MRSRSPPQTCWRATKRSAAALEVALGGLRLRFGCDVRFALAGASCDADLDGARVDAWGSYAARAGMELTLRRPRASTRTYVAIAGGIGVASVLNSRDTNVRGFFRRVRGARAARRATSCRSDRKRVRSFAPDARPRCKPPQWDFAAGAFARPELPRALLARRRVRAMLSHDDARDAFWSNAFAIAPQSNRMGARLTGARRALEPGAAERASHAVFPGVVQLPPSGEPIVLLADAQTTGGYPKLGVRDRGRSLEDRANADRQPFAFRAVLARGGGRGASRRRVVLGARGRRRCRDAIDLNADLGEGCGADARAARTGDARRTSRAAGTPATRRRCARPSRLGAAAGVAIGAHPSYPDRENFGRKAMSRAPEDVYADVPRRSARSRRSSSARRPHAHVKPHGALYNRAARDDALADAIAPRPSGTSIRRSRSSVSPAAPRFARPARPDLRAVEEGFADRAYTASGELVARGTPGAMIDDAERSVRQVFDLIERGIETICVHGDAPGSAGVCAADPRIAGSDERRRFCRRLDVRTARIRGNRQRLFGIPQSARFSGSPVPGPSLPSSLRFKNDQTTPGTRHRARCRLCRPCGGLHGSDCIRSRKRRAR